MRTAITVGLGALSLAIACGTGGGGTLEPDASAADGGVSSKDGSVINADGATKPDAAGDAGSDGAIVGAWGPCSLASVNHSSATQVQPRGLVTVSCNGSGSIASTIDLANSQAELDQLLGTADAGDAGTLTVDFSTESVIAVHALSSAAFTYGTEGTQLVIAVGAFCQGVAPQCENTFYAVPKVTGTIVAQCPPPGEPCTAP